MVDSVGRAAGEVWKHLDRVGEESIYRIGRELGLSHALCNQAIGWLAREGKICIRRAGRATYISLTGE